MVYNYLDLVNRLCYKFNEVPLDSSTFATADGIYNEFKSAINAGIADICKKKNNEWPFNWQELQFQTTAGTSLYIKAANALNVDWDSFQIVKQPISVTSITQSAGVAIATTSTNHNLLSNDLVYISGADQSNYVDLFYITVISPTTFTFSVDSNTITPATGTIVVYPPYNNTYLKGISFDAYRQEGYQTRDNNAYKTDQYGMPYFSVRKTDNNIIISPKPDRVYTIQYESFIMPSDLVLYSDVPIIPVTHKEVIIEAALYAIYMFRDNVEEAGTSQSVYDKSIETMARILIPQSDTMRIVN